MTIRILVSADPTAAFDSSWECVGTLDRADPTINGLAAKALHKNQSGGRVRIEFYLSGDPESPWVKGETDHAPFGIAFDLFGDETRILVADKAATVASLTSRPPEPHPGLRVRPTFLGLKVGAALTRV